MTLSRRNILTLFVGTLLAGFVLGFFAQRVTAAVRGSVLYPDVQAGAFYDVAVGEMAGLGVIQGYEDGRFGPNDYVTRGQVAVLMMRLRNELKGLPVNGTSSSSSSSSSSRSSSSRSSSSSSSSSSSVQAGAAGAFRFSKDEVDIVESSRNLSLTINRVDGSKGAANVTYTLSGATAKSGEDFSGTSGVVSFADGETQKIITIAIVEDKVGEIHETFHIILGNPTGGAVLGSPSEMVVTILDNDGGVPGGSGGSSSSAAGTNTVVGFAFGASEYTVGEDQGSATITVVRYGSTSAAASVDYATSHGTANTANYNPVSGTLNFSSGEASKTFTVSVINNSDIAGNKTVNLTLSNPTGSQMATPSTSLLSIADDDMSSYVTGTGTIRFDKSSYSVVESVGHAAITVSRINGSKGTVTVNYATTGGSAASNSDYTPVNGTLTFAPGETKKVFFVPVIDDAVPSEQEEVVNLSLSSVGGGGTLGVPSIAELKISE